MIANFFSVNSDTLPPGVATVDDMKTHYSLTCRLKYTDAATSQNEELVSTYSKGGIITANDIQLVEKYYTRN